MRFDGLDELLGKEMSRKQFVGHVGSGLLVLLGVGGLVKALMGTNKRSSQVANGYGSSSYGGNKR